MSNAFKTSEDVVKTFNAVSAGFGHDETYQSLKRSVDCLGPFKCWNELDEQTYDKTVKEMQKYLASKNITQPFKL